MWKFKNNTILGIISVLVIGLYIHWSIGEIITESLVYIWYMILVVCGLIGLMSILYAIRVLITHWIKQTAQAQMATIEGVKASRDVREFGGMVFQFGVDKKEITHALHLDPYPYSNGVYVAPTNEQIEIYNTFNRTFNQQNNYYGDQDNKPVYDGVPLLEDGMNDNWIDDILKSPHIHLAGETGSGKSTFALMLISKLIKMETGADFWLIDPKHKASDPAWPIDPFVKDIGVVISGLMKLVDMLDVRKNDINYHPDKDANQIIIIDDWDWIYEHYGKEAVSVIRILIKIGRALNFRVLLIGQSTLSGDTGLSRSDYSNMNSVCLRREAYQMLKMLQSLTTTEKHSYREKLATMEKNGQRYALIVPYSGLPIVKEIPDLSHYLDVPDKPILKAPLLMDLTADERELTMIDAAKKGKGVTELAVILTGKKRKLINGIDTAKARKIAQQAGIKV